MKQEYLNTITQTATGLPVKNLRWLTIDNIITGLVECPILNKTISGQWRRNGTPTNSIKGRAELKLEINLEMSIVLLQSGVRLAVVKYQWAMV